MTRPAPLNVQQTVYAIQHRTEEIGKKANVQMWDFELGLGDLPEMAKRVNDETLFRAVSTVLARVHSHHDFVSVGSVAGIYGIFYHRAALGAVQPTTLRLGGRDGDLMMISQASPRVHRLFLASAELFVREFMDRVRNEESSEECVAAGKRALEFLRGIE